MIRFHTLGDLQLRDVDGREILSVVAQPKRLALLSYLAISGNRFHRRDTLLGVFWPESDQRHARDSLRQAVRYLRRSLGEGVVIGRGDDELGVDESLLWCDAAAFERAVEAGEHERALDLYRGDLLEGFFHSDVPDFERWLEGERGRLRRLAVEAAWTLAEEREAAGDTTGAIRHARRAAGLCPEDEGTLRRLIAVLARLGDRASAVRAYEEFAARLAEDVGVEPSAETRALVQEVRAPDAVTVDLALPAEVWTRPAPAGFAALASAPEPLDGPDGGEGPIPRDDRRMRRSPPRWVKLGFAGVLILLVIAAAGVIVSGALGKRSGVERVVVVPFENQTGEASLDPLGRWATDWVIRGLARMEHLQVIDAVTGLPGSGPGALQQGSLGSLVEETGARLVVGGAYYRHGDSIQFQVRISDGERGVVPAVEPLGGSLEQPQAAIQALGERITGALAAYVDPRIRALNSDGSRPPSYEAYQAWVDGLQHYNLRKYPGAQERFLHAASLDPSFVTPLIWAAATYARSGDYAPADSLLGVVNTRRSSLLPFDRHLLDRWRSLMRGDRFGEYQASLRMLEVAPASELALYLVGQTALAINLPGEALRALRRIDVKHSAADWDLYGTRLTHAYHLLDDHAKELDEARRVRRRRPELLRGITDEVRALAALGRVSEIPPLLDRALSLPAQSQETPGDVARSAAEELRAHGHGVAADEALARALAWYRTRPPEERATEAYRYGLARVLYRAGRWDEAEPIFRELSGQFPANVDYLGHLGVLSMRRGDTREAERISAILSMRAEPHLQGRNTYWRARIAAVARRRDEAVTLLRASFAQGQSYGLEVHAEPDFGSLRDHSPFRRLLQPRG